MQKYIINFGDTLTDRYLWFQIGDSVKLWDVERIDISNYDLIADSKDGLIYKIFMIMQSKGYLDIMSFVIHFDRYIFSVWSVDCILRLLYVFDSDSMILRFIINGSRVKESLGYDYFDLFIPYKAVSYIVKLWQCEKLEKIMSLIGFYYNRMLDVLVGTTFKAYDFKKL